MQEATSTSFLSWHGLFSWQCVIQATLHHPFYPLYNTWDISHHPLHVTLSLHYVSIDPRRGWRKSRHRMHALVFAWDPDLSVCASMQEYRSFPKSRVRKSASSVACLGRQRWIHAKYQCSCSLGLAEISIWGCELKAHQCRKEHPAGRYGRE